MPRDGKVSKHGKRRWFQYGLSSLFLLLLLTAIAARCGKPWLNRCFSRPPVELTVRLDLDNIYFGSERVKSLDHLERLLARKKELLEFEHSQRGDRVLCQCLVVEAVRYSDLMAVVDKIYAVFPDAETDFRVSLPRKPTDAPD